jgi:KamA family protein
MLMTRLAVAGRYRAYGPHHIDELAARFGMHNQVRETLRTVAMVLPFRVNEHVLSALIDWSNVPEDPVFQLVFPQAGMLSADDELRLRATANSGKRRREVVEEIRSRLNPHPSGQLSLNVPRHQGRKIPGLQRKYRETLLYFPGHGQTCHAYCTYCFRWAQFVGDPDLRFAAPGPAVAVEYLRRHPVVTDVLLTGGDPMIMTTERLRSHIEPLLAVDTVQTIRIGSKSPAYWPQRYVTDADADALLRLFDEVVNSGKNLALMAHFSHPRELEPPIARRALSRIRATGTLIYAQAPIIARVNDDAITWADLWRAELACGVIPYYAFMERDTGPHEYFKVPIARAQRIFADAYRTLPGLARTVRGPVMSATPGKVVIDGTVDGPQGRYFQLRMLQARNPALVGRPFLARWSPTAAWLDDLDPGPSTPTELLRAVWPGTSADLRSDPRP